MDPRDFFRGVFGIPRNHPRTLFPDQQDEEQEEQEEHNPQGFQGSFHVYTNPLEMEKFFSQQFDEILKQFGFGAGGHFGTPGMFSGPMQPDDKFPLSGEEETGARDFMLKKDNHPGYLRPETTPERRRDVEVDEFSPDDLEKLYPHPSHGHLQPKNVRVNIFFFQLPSISIFDF